MKERISSIDIRKVARFGVYGVVGVFERVVIYTYSIIEKYERRMVYVY